MSEYELDLTDVESEDDFGGDDFQVPEEGQYHVSIVGVDDEKEGSLKVSFQILDGTESGQEEIRFNNFFNLPSSSHKDGGKFCARVIGRLAVITRLARVGQKASIDWMDLIGRQLVVAVKHRIHNEKTYAEIDLQGSALGMWSVDAEEVDDVPKDEAAAAQWKKAAKKANPVF